MYRVQPTNGRLYLMYRVQPTNGRLYPIAVRSRPSLLARYNARSAR